MPVSRDGIPVIRDLSVEPHRERQPSDGEERISRRENELLPHVEVRVLRDFDGHAVALEHGLEGLAPPQPRALSIT